EGIRAPDFPLVREHADNLRGRTRELEVELIRSALARSNGNRTRAARSLGLSRQGLWKKIRRLSRDAVGAESRAVAALDPAARAVADYESLLRSDDIDAVIIATPNHLHAPMTMAALGYGKHVLCEKPAARTAAEAAQMAVAAERSGKVLMYAMNNRFRSDVAVLRGYLERQELGKIFYAKTGWLRRKTERRGPGWYENKKSSGGGV